MIKDYFASKGWLTKYAQAEDSRGMWQKYVDEVEAERVQESRSMVHEPRNMYNQGSSVDHAVRTIDPVQDSGNKIEEVLKAYELYIKNRPGGRPMKFKTFFEEYGKENFATGGQAGQLVSNTVDGSRPGYAGVTSLDEVKESLEAKIKELGGKEKVTRILTDGSGTGPERTLLREILTGGNKVIKGTGNFVKGALNPVNFFKDFFKLRNLIGFPAAVAAVVYDTVMVTDDMLRKRQTFDVAAGNEFLLGMLNLQPEIEEAKRLLADPKSSLSPAAKEYAQSLVDIGEYNNLLKLKQMPMKVAGMPGDSEDQEKLQKQLDMLDKKMSNTSTSGELDYLKEITEKDAQDQAGSYIGEPISSKGGPMYARDGDGNLIKVNEYGYGRTGLKDFLGDAPDKTGAPSFFSGELKKAYGDIEQKEGQLPTTGTKLVPAYVSQNYKTMKEAPLNLKEINVLTDYERKRGLLKPNQNLDEVFYNNVRFKKNNEGMSTLHKIKGLSPLGEYENLKKWEQAINQPGIKGTQDRFATGGLAGLMEKYNDKR